jgi:glycosyltransferase involved in cell wall biosynthesis
MTMSLPKSVSAIIVNYEGGELLVDCVAALDTQTGLLETIIVDNASADGSTAAAAARFPQVKIVRPGRNLGFAGGANVGAVAASGELLLFLNPYFALLPGSIDALATEFSDPLAGAVGPPIAVAASDTTEYGCTLDPIGSPVGLSKPAAPLYVAGCALMTRTRLFHDLGGFDERFFMFVEDADYCWRVLLRGYDVRVTTQTPVRHEGGAVAPGGYLTATGVTSTKFRIVLRERNTLAMLFKCYSFPLLVLIVPLYVGQSIATAVALAAVGERSTARGIVGGLWWNARELRRTLALRREAQRSRQGSEHEIRRRMYRGIWKLTLLSRFGMPTVREVGPS